MGSYFHDYVSIPTWAEYFLAYGEDDSLTSEDKGYLEAFTNRCQTYCQENGYSHYTLSRTDSEQSPYFSFYHELGNLGCECVDYTVTYFKG